MDLSTRGQLGSFGRFGSRFVNSSPLAGRGLAVDPVGHDRLSSLSITGNELDDFDILDDFDMAAYLGDGRGTGRADTIDTFGDATNIDAHAAAEAEEIVPSLSQADRNFFEFLKGHIKSEQSAEGIAEDVPTMQSPESKKEITFSTLLPPEKTTRAVATQGLMHVLTLATKDIVAVRQDNGDETNDVCGEIYLKIREPYN